MPQLQINQGPQDALLYDNTRSYFTNVGYVRTSNFQVEYRDVDPQNTAQLGSTVQFVIPKAADLLGPVDLRVKLKAPDADGVTGTIADNTAVWSQWVDEVGFAMIEKCTFSVGSNDIETITGDQMQIKNELMTSDEQRLGFDHILKTGRRALAVMPVNQSPDDFSAERPGDNQTLPSTYHKVVNKDYTRLISYAAADDPACGQSLTGTLTGAYASDKFTGTGLTAKGVVDGARIVLTGTLPGGATAGTTYFIVSASDTEFKIAATKGGTAISLTTSNGSGITGTVLGETPLKAGARELIIPLSLFFTKHVSQYFPLAAVAGCNDVRISIKFRALNELIQTYAIGATATITGNQLYTSGNAIDSSEGCQLRCHYVHVTGPEATTLMNKEHVRLMKLWQHQHKNFKEVGASFDLDLSFLHPVTTLIITIRREEDMSSNTISTDADCVQKGYFFYHGDGTNPNYDRALDQDGTTNAAASLHSVKVTSLQLTLNGQERHPGLSHGIDTAYLQHRLLPQLHSNSNAFDKQMAASYGSLKPDALVDGTANAQLEALQRHELKGSKNILVYPFSLNPEGSNPSGAVNFSKVSHAKLRIFTDTSTTAGSPLHKDTAGGTNYRVDVYGLYYNWLQIKDGRALLSFA